MTWYLAYRVLEVDTHVISGRLNMTLVSLGNRGGVKSGTVTVHIILGFIPPLQG